MVLRVLSLLSLIVLVLFHTSSIVLARIKSPLDPQRFVTIRWGDDLIA
jgi:hypothetical protein